MGKISYEGEWSCDYCGADKEWNKECPGCFSKKRPSRRNAETVQIANGDEK